MGGPHLSLTVPVNRSLCSLEFSLWWASWGTVLCDLKWRGLCASACKCLWVVGVYFWVWRCLCLHLAYGCVSVWVCACVRGCVFLIEGVHSSRCGLFLPVGDGGRCEVRVARAGWSCFLFDWPGWLLLGNSQALRCHGAWKRGMNHPPSLPAYRNFFPVPRAGFHQKS